MSRFLDCAEAFRHVAQQYLTTKSEAQYFGESGRHLLDGVRLLDHGSMPMLYRQRGLFADALAKRAADVFNTDLAVITTIDKDREYFVGQSGKLPNAITDDTGTLLPMDREHAICNYFVADQETLVVSDIERDPHFADNETIEPWNMRFYAGAPLRTAGGLIIGALCILDAEPVPWKRTKSHCLKRWRLTSSPQLQPVMRQKKRR